MTSYKIRSFIRDVKNQWKKRALKKGFSYLILASVFYFLLYFLLEYFFKVTPLLRGIEVIAASITILYILINTLFRPAFRRYDDKRIALLIEEKIPDLEDRINSAVEICQEKVKKEKDLVINQLIDDAIKKTRLIDLDSVVDRKKEKILTYLANAVFILFLVFLVSFFNDISNLMGNLDVSFNPVTELNKNTMVIEPGDIQIEKGESQDIIITFNREIPDDVTLHYASGEDIWRTQRLEKGFEKPVYIHQFLNIQEPINYYVEFKNDKSKEYSISLYEFPKVIRIDLKYVYPAYSGISPRTEENTGDIRGLKGSEVFITIETNGTAKSGNMVYDNNNSLPLRSIGDNKFETSITLNDSGYYHIDLVDSRQEHNKYPEEYQVTPVNDERPIIFVTEPQRDIRANLVEEVLISTTVTDDYGIDRVNLKYSVNGEDEKTVQMLEDNQKGENKISSSHLIYLEEFTLQPGDVIAYYIEAEDNCRVNFPEYSDMYFIEITSLDTRFSQSGNRGGNNSGGGSQSQTVLNQQKIISATWKLIRTKNDTPESKFKESLTSVSKAQSDLRDNINSRMNSQGFSGAIRDQNDEKLVENLKKAVTEMTDAIKELEKPDLKKALKEEQQALTYLLRAEAINNEKRVQMSRGGANSGGGGNSNDRISELMDLELDIDKQKYEMQQQRQQMQENQEVDEALQKVKELARRQEKLAERAQRNLQAEEEKRALERLKRDQEEVRQQAEELTNQLRNLSRENQQISRQMQERMGKISENMKKAEEELKNNNPQKALSHQQSALNELERLQQDLQMSHSDNYREMTGNFVRKFEQFKQQENNFEKDLDRTYQKLRKNKQNKIDKSDIDRLVPKRDRSFEELRDIREQARIIEELTKREDPDISSVIRNFQNDLQREQLERNLLISKRALEGGWISYAKLKEYEIQDSIERLDRQVRELAGKLPMTEEERLNRTLTDVRELLEKYDEITESLNDRISRENNPEPEEGERQDVATDTRNADGNREPENSETARLQSQLDRMRQMIDDARRTPGMGRDYQNAMESLGGEFGKLHNIGKLLDEAGLEYFKKNVYNPLSQLEFQLVKKLDEVGMDKKLHSGRKAVIPPRYRKIVDKYYETISKSNEKKKK